MSFRKLAAAAAVASIAAAFVLPAQADPLTNGPNGKQPNSLASNNPVRGGNANKPSRAMMGGKTKSHMRRMH